jgi:CTP synthase
VGFAAEGVDEIVLRLLRTEARPRDLSRWKAMLARLQNPQDEVSIAVVGKYVEYEDSYKSLKEALLHGGLAHQLKTNVNWVEAEGVVGENWDRQLEGYDGILVPGGFGKRGIDGMLNAIQFARERKVPYFGICLGMQTLVIEYARNVCGMDDADSTEFNPGTPHRVIFKLRELKGVDELGGTMRLGSWPCKLAQDSFAHRAYGQREIHERHRHRYEFNREYEDRLKAAGLRITGETPDNTYVEICEIGDHPWFLGCQFHPEFKSKPMEPHPLFKAFIGASYGYRRRRMTPLVQQDVPEEGDLPQEEVPQEAEVPRESAEAPREEPQYSRAT